ncbi:MAG: hypothetical protein NT124_03165 [Candidatus Dependentiae bacterium]|nr:hypothetical protein [Candidatus Dependentiae bacterium]
MKRIYVVLLVLGVGSCQAAQEGASWGDWFVGRARQVVELGASGAGQVAALAAPVLARAREAVQARRDANFEYERARIQRLVTKYYDPQSEEDRAVSNSVLQTAGDLYLSNLQSVIDTEKLRVFKQAKSDIRDILFAVCGENSYFSPEENIKILSTMLNKNNHALWICRYMSTHIIDTFGLTGFLSDRRCEFIDHVNSKRAENLARDAGLVLDHVMPVFSAARDSNGFSNQSAIAQLVLDYEGTDQDNQWEKVS